MKKQTTGLIRNITDKYYTNKAAVTLCIEAIKQHIVINSSTHLIIEPSAGNGAFIDSIKTLTTNHVFYDIYPEHKEILKVDFIADVVIQNSDKYESIHVIGNPPFGRQSSLAIKFIKKSAQFANSISFILPRSFKKDSLKKHFPHHFHLIYEIDIPSESFLVNDIVHDVPCVFQIWVKKDTKRFIKNKPVPNNYVFVKKNDIHDISVRRVGVYAGEISRETEGKSIQSHYFIKFANCIDEKTYDLLSNIIYECKENTVGPKSISKPELIEEFNKIL